MENNLSRDVVMRRSLTIWHSLIMLSVTMMLLTLSACASWHTPEDVDVSTLRERAEIAEIRGVRVKAAVLSIEDSQQMLGVNVYENSTLPVWIEVENATDQVLWLLRAGTDPNYFSPLEVAWGFHTSFSSEANSKLDNYLDQSGFKSLIAPNSTQSGIIFANLHHNTMLLNVDLLGHKELFPFTLFPVIPDDFRDETLEKLERRLSTPETVDYQQVDKFRAALRLLPCCAKGGDGTIASGDPINMVVVGQFSDIASAGVRRGFRAIEFDFDNKQQLFGRQPDIVIRKAGRGNVISNWMRMWLAPITFQGQPVFLVQAGRPIGGRFADSTGESLKLHPNVDEVRDMLIGDFLYSGGLAKLGFVTSSGARIPMNATQQDTLGMANYQTDGLRAVLFMVTRPLSLEDIQFLDWVPHLENIEANAMENNGNTQH